MPGWPSGLRRWTVDPMCIARVGSNPTPGINIRDIYDLRELYNIRELYTRTCT